jgi:hypothetical protein
MPRMRGETLSLTLFFVLVAAFYVWTAASSVPFRFDDSTIGSGRYGWLADALVHGQLHLRKPVPDGLLALNNPYDPVANLPYRKQGLQDLTLWDGKLYLYWGIVPELLLFAPLRVLGIWMSQSLAATIFYFGGFVFSLLTLRFLVRRFLPETPTWALWTGFITLACCNVVPFSLRHGTHSEIAIGSGLCFGFAAIWLLLTGWFSESNPLSSRRVAAASLALGLAIGSRPTWIVAAAVPCALVVVAWRSSRWPAGLVPRRFILALWGPLAACGAVVMAYNFARFGSPFELGTKHQLAGFDQRHYPPFDVRFLGPGLFYYVLEPPRLEALFPFVSLGPPPTFPWKLPPGYQSSEMTAGLLSMTPIVASLVLLPVAARRWDADLRRITFTLVGVGIGMLVLVAGALWSTTERYAADFTSLLLIGAILVWLTALGSVRRRSRRRLVHIVGVAVLLWSVTLGIAVGFTGYGQPLPKRHPVLWERLESAFSPVSRAMALMRGHPIIGRVVAPMGETKSDGSWVSPGPDEAGVEVGSRPVLMRVASAHRKVYRLTAVVGRGSDVALGVPMVLGIAVGDQAPVEVGIAGQDASLAGLGQVVVVPVVLDGGVTSISLTARADRITGPKILQVLRMRFEAANEDGGAP